MLLNAFHDFDWLLGYYLIDNMTSIDLNMNWMELNWLDTSRRLIWRARSATLWSPTMFISMATLRSKSNLTRAAEWKTTDTLSMSICLSKADRPSFSTVMSPLTATSFFSASGRFIRIPSNTYTKSQHHSQRHYRQYRIILFLTTFSLFSFHFHFIFILVFYFFFFHFFFSFFSIHFYFHFHFFLFVSFFFQF